MALIIKGNMPTFCERLTEDGNNMEYCRFACVCESHNISTMAIPSDCYILGEISDNHGRIVDLDKVLDWLINEKRVFSMAMSAKLVNALSDAPVILEAST